MAQPRLCVFGTSNGLFKDGYVAGCRQVFGEDAVVNCSVGASSALVWEITKQLVDLSAFDWGLLDYCVNDGLMIRGGLNTIERWRSAMLNAAAEMRAASCQPAMLILPAQNLFGRENPLLGESIRLANELRIPYLDGYGLLQRVVARKAGLKPEALFRDPAHLQPALSRVIGSLLAARLVELGSRRETWGGDLAVDVEFPRYRYIEGEALAPADRLVERATSLVKRRFAVITPDQPLAVAMGPDEKVCAVALDLAKSIGALVLTGDGRWTKSWTNNYYFQWEGVERAMVFSVLPFLRSIGAGDDGVVSLTAQPDAAAPCDESWGGARDGGSRSQIALSGVVAEQPPRRHAIAVPFSAPLPLADMFDDADLDRIAEAVPSS